MYRSGFHLIERQSLEITVFDSETQRKVNLEMEHVCFKRKKFPMVPSCGGERGGRACSQLAGLAEAAKPGW